MIAIVTEGTAYCVGGVTMVNCKSRYDSVVMLFTADSTLIILLCHQFTEQRRAAEVGFVAPFPGFSHKMRITRFALPFLMLLGILVGTFSTPRILSRFPFLVIMEVHFRIQPVLTTNTLALISSVHFTESWLSFLVCTLYTGTVL